jgi:hypothetical protein
MCDRWHHLPSNDPSGEEIANIDPLDSTVDDRAAQHLSPQHVRQSQIDGVKRPPGDLFSAADSRRRTADDFSRLTRSCRLSDLDPGG